MTTGGGASVQGTKDMEGDDVESPNNDSIESSEEDEEEINHLPISSSVPPRADCTNSTINRHDREKVSDTCLLPCSDLL